MLELEFTADWQVRPRGRLIARHPVKLAYDERRLPQCRSHLPGGAPAWSLVAFWQLNAGPVHHVFVAGRPPSHGLTPGVFTPHEAGHLTLWFQVSNLHGCSAWDSDHGRNFHFTVAPG